MAWTISKDVALLDQHVGVLDPRESILTSFRKKHPLSLHEVAHRALARFEFRTQAAEQVVSTVSGGERLQAGLADVLGEEVTPQLLLLD